MLSVSYINNRTQEIDDQRMSRLAPSVFATEASDNTSDKYSFIPTIDVVNILRSQDWVTVAANQSRFRKQSKRDEVKHIVRLRHRSSLDANNLALDGVPELILTNSHDATSAFRFNLGYYRMVCANGLMAGDTLSSQSVRHIGFNKDKVIEASYRILEDTPKLVESVNTMRNITLSDDEKTILAKSALDLRYDALNPSPITASQLLTKRRSSDYNNDLWTQFNLVQENMIKGGLRYYKRDDQGRMIARQRTREVTSIPESSRLNKALWTLAESMRDLKQANTA